MALTIATKTYNFDSNPTADSARYTGPAQTAVVKDEVLLKRQAPKVTLTSKGSVKRILKTVKSEVDAQGVLRIVSAETYVSYDVGASPTLVTALRVDHAALLSHACAQTLIDGEKLVY